MKESLFKKIVEALPYPLVIKKNNSKIVYNNIEMNKKMVRKFDEYATYRTVFFEGNDQYEMIIVEHQKNSKQVEELQKKWGQTLHDQIAQDLFALSLYIHASKNQSTVDIERIEKMISQLLEQVRKLAYDIRSEPLERSFSEQLEEEIKKWNDWTLFDVKWVKEGNRLPKWPENLTSDLLFIIKEAVSNAIRHSKGTTITINTTYKEGNFSFSIQDNGIGVGKRVVKQHLGWIHMDERIQKWGGTIDIHSNGKNGTIIKGWLPFGRERAFQNESNDC